MRSPRGAGGRDCFAQRLAQLESACRVTGLARQQSLVASPILPFSREQESFQDLHR